MGLAPVDADRREGNEQMRLHDAIDFEFVTGRIGVQNVRRANGPASCLCITRASAYCELINNSAEQGAVINVVNKLSR